MLADLGFQCRAQHLYEPFLVATCFSSASPFPCWALHCAVRVVASSHIHLKRLQKSRRLQKMHLKRVLARGVKGHLPNGFLHFWAHGLQDRRESIECFFACCLASLFVLSDVQGSDGFLETAICWEQLFAGCVLGRHGPTGRPDRQTDRQADRQTSRQTDKQTDRQADRQTDRQKKLDKDSKAHRQTGRQPHRQTDTQGKHKRDRKRRPERTGKRKDRKRPEDGPEEDRKQKPGKDRNRFPDPGPEDRNRTGRGKTAGPEEDRNNCI